MIILIDDEAARLKKNPAAAHPDYHPFTVSVWRDKRSRSPVFVRRKTLRDAKAFVEDVTGLSAVRYVRQGGDTTGLWAFTGSHTEAYYDTAQYKPVTEEESCKA